MLKSNSKKAIENIRLYVVDHFDPENYESNFWEKIETEHKLTKLPLNRFSVAAHYIYNCFYHEKVVYNNRRVSEQQLFFDWCAGLPSILDTCYYYNRSAVDDLATILEETDSEKAKYTEAQAEERLTYLIYREIKKAVK